MLKKNAVLLALLLWTFVAASAQCLSCGNGTVDPGETSQNCPQDVSQSATCSSPCAQPTSFESTTGIRQAFDFVGTTTWSTVGLPSGWTFAGGPSATTAGALPAADAYGAKAGLIQPNCAGSCTATNGFCIGNLANNVAVGSGGASGKLGANFDGRANINANLSYAVLRGQSNPTLVSPTFNMSAVQGFKVQFWLFPSESSCGQLNSWGSCVGNAAFLDFSTNGGTTWSQVLQMDISSSSSDMCFNNSTNTKWLTESAWSRVCVTVFRSTSSPGNFYSRASSSSAASGIMVNSAFFTSTFKFRIRYSQTASCTSGITTTNPGRYLAIDYPVITSGNEMIPCGISFANMCGYGADDNDDGVGSSTLFSSSIAHGTVRRGVHEAERGVEILTSQNAAFTPVNLSGSNLASNFDLCNAEGGDKQCIDWQTNNNFYTAVYECITDWEAPSGTGVNVQYYKGTSPQSFGLTKVTTSGKTPAIGWRYSGSRFVSCSSLSDLNPGCNGYSFLSGSLPTQFARGFYALAMTSTGDSWSYYGASSCSHYYNGPFFAPISIPDTLTNSPNYTICVSGNLVFTGLSSFCSSGTGMSGAASITVTGPGGFSEVISSGGQGSTPIVDPGVYTIIANLPSSPTQCLDCRRLACITVSSLDLSGCGLVPVPGLSFSATVQPDQRVVLRWNMLHDEDAESYTVQRKTDLGDWETLAQYPSILDHEDYVFQDPAAWAGARSYRLQLQHPNGEISFSEVQRVLVQDQQLLQVFPIPAQDQVRIRLNADVARFSASLYDLAGRQLMQQAYEGAEGTMNLEGLAAGAYLLKATVAGKSYLQKVLID